MHAAQDTSVQFGAHLGGGESVRVDPDGIATLFSKGDPVTVFVPTYSQLAAIRSGHGQIDITTAQIHKARTAERTYNW
jgi:hypothetical protein